jgi:ABC-type transport system substrate-binding protein
MRRQLKSVLVPVLFASTLLGLTGGLALAAEPAPAPPPNWWDTLTVGGTAEGGLTLNPDIPAMG